MLISSSSGAIRINSLASAVCWRSGRDIQWENTSQKLLGVSSHGNLAVALFGGPQCTAQGRREFCPISSPAPKNNLSQLGTGKCWC